MSGIQTSAAKKIQRMVRKRNKTRRNYENSNNNRLRLATLSYASSKRPTLSKSGMLLRSDYHRHKRFTRNVGSFLEINNEERAKELLKNIFLSHKNNPVPGVHFAVYLFKSTGRPRDIDFQWHVSHDYDRSFAKNFGEFESSRISDYGTGPIMVDFVWRFVMLEVVFQRTHLPNPLFDEINDIVALLGH